MCVRARTPCALSMALHMFLIVCSTRFPKQQWEKIDKLTHGGRLNFGTLVYPPGSRIIPVAPRVSD